MKKHGVIINVASAAGLYPSVADPIYSGSKGIRIHIFLKLIIDLFCSPKYFFEGGVVMFTRSLALLKREGIRINTICPEVKNWIERQCPCFERISLSSSTFLTRK